MQTSVSRDPSGSGREKKDLSLNESAETRGKG